MNTPEIQRYDEPLKPCPFCDGAPNESVSDGGSPSGYATISCENKECTVNPCIDRKFREWDHTGTGEPQETTWRILGKRWNTRPQGKSPEAVWVWVRKSPLEFEVYSVDGMEGQWIAEGWRKMMLAIVPDGFEVIPEGELAALKSAEDRVKRLEAALKNLLDDMVDRAKTLADYNNKPVELPVGNGVLYEARAALAES